MPRKSKTKVIVETRMPDGGWIQLPGTENRDFTTIPDAEMFIGNRIRPGQVWRISRVTGEYFVKQELVKR